MILDTLGGTWHTHLQFLLWQFFGVDFMFNANANYETKISASMFCFAWTWRSSKNDGSYPVAFRDVVIAKMS